MRRFIVRQNIAHFKSVLADEISECERSHFEALLADAQSELLWLERIWSWTCPRFFIHDSLGAEAEDLLTRAVMAHGANFGSLQLWDEAEGNLHLIAHNGFDHSSVQQFANVKDGDGTVCEAARVLQAPVIVADIEKSGTFTSLRNWTRAIGIRAIQTTPVFSRSGRFVGAFSTHYAGPHAFGEHERQINGRYAEDFSRLFEEMGIT